MTTVRPSLGTPCRRVPRCQFGTPVTRERPRVGRSSYGREPHLSQLHAENAGYGCDVSQDVCPYNIKFSRALADDSPYAAREALGGEHARTLARDLLGMTPPAFSAAFKGSPMKRAKLRGLKRNAAVVLGNLGSAEDVDVLTRALDDEEPLVREHAAWAMARLRAVRT